MSVNKKYLTANEKLLENLPPGLRPQIKEVLIAPMREPIHVQIPRRSKQEKYASRFVMFIPYGGTELLWQCSYDLADETFCPDFEFRNEEFLSDPDVNVIKDYIPALCEWDLKNSKCLYHVIVEFLFLYKTSSLSVLENSLRFSKYFYEYENLIKTTHYKAEDVEVCAEKNAAHFLVSLKLDFSKLLYYVQKFLINDAGYLVYLNPGGDEALFKISFVNGLSIAHLSLSPRLEQHLGGYKLLHLPLYDQDQEMKNYVMYVEKLLKERLKEVLNFQQIRKDFIFTILAVQGSTILSYDCVKFNYVDLLIEHEEIANLVSIELSDVFPSLLPTVTLKSSCFLYKNEPRTWICNTLKFNPHSSGQEIAISLLKDLQDEIPKFVEKCKELN